LGTEQVQNQYPEMYLDNVLSGHPLPVNQPTAYSTFYSQHLPALDSSQPPPPVYIPSVYIHHPEGNSPDLAQTPPDEGYLPYNAIPPKDRPDSYASPQTSSIPIITLNPNNFSGNSSNPSNIRYVAEASRKRASINVVETENDSLNAKRIKNREAARRWRQGKKDQIADLQGEVYVLRTKLDTLQTEMETLRLENQYLKQELSKTRQTKASQPPAQSPLLSFATHPFRAAPSNPPHDMNLLPTPSLFLLCLFLFSLCMSLPFASTAFPGTDQTISSLTEIRQPRLFHSSMDSIPGQKILNLMTGQDSNWFLSMFASLFHRILPQNPTNGMEGSLGLKVGLGDMNQILSLRLDRLL